MLEKIRHPQTMMLGCPLLLVGLLLSLTVLAMLAIRSVQTRSHYPGAVHVDNQNRYTVNYIRWADTYHTSDSLTEIYTWYINQAGLSMVVDTGVERSCVLLYGTKQRFFIERSMNVSVCETPTGQSIVVSQSAWFQ